MAQSAMSTQRIMPVIQNITGMTLDVRGIRGGLDVMNTLRIDQGNLSGEFAAQASWYGIIVVKLAEAEWVLARQKAQLDQLYAQLDAAYRNAYADQGSKYTEAVIKAAIIQDSEYIELQEYCIELEYHVGVLKGLSNSMKQRADMLISLGAQSRLEWELTGSHINAINDDLAKSAKDAISARSKSS